MDANETPNEKPRHPAWVDRELEGIRAADLWREPAIVESRRPGFVTVAGREYVDFASNDYLGLAADPRIADAVRSWLEAGTWGSAASPMIVGHHAAHDELQRELARFLGAESALLFGSGFLANAASISAIAGRADIIFSDRRNHASLIDGCRLSKAVVSIYDSDQLGRLAEQLAEAKQYRRRLIVTDGVFSMEGDVAPLGRLCELADEFDAMLYVDEAHGLGVVGPEGKGASALMGVEDRVTLRMGTLGKAFGSSGAFVAGTRKWIDWLRHKARGHVFSTAAPAADAVAGLAGLRLAEQEPFRRQRANELADVLRLELAAIGMNTLGSTTPIVPILLNSPKQTIMLAEALQKEGIWVAAIRPPTVPVGSCRLRISVSAAHELGQLQRLRSLLGAC